MQMWSKSSSISALVSLLKKLYSFKGYPSYKTMNFIMGSRSQIYIELRI